MTVSVNKLHGILATRVVRFFLSEFPAATLNGAIERAAIQEREKCLWDEFSTIPVDIDTIAMRKGIRIVEGGIKSNTLDGELEATSTGFVVRLNPKTPEYRRRFTLAHELGHTLFYKDGQHRIGVLDRREFDAEELICNRFGSALLVPKAPLSEELRLHARMEPFQILQHIGQVARRFKVSLEALLSRLSVLQVHSPPAVVLCLRYRENRQTGAEPTLRVTQCVNLGRDRRYWTFSNRSVSGIRLKSALELFDGWKLRIGTETAGGQYVWSRKTGTVRASELPDATDIEQVELSVWESGRWIKRAVTATVSNCLYSRPNSEAEDIYIVSILKPEQPLGTTTTSATH